MSMEKTQQEYRDEYRAQLLDYAKESQMSYDKTLIALSGGALGVSFAFVEQFTSKGPVQLHFLLVASWICWVVSLSLILFSFYTSNRAMLRAIHRLDSDPSLSANPGGFFDRVTKWFNLVAGILFIVGVASVVWFALVNL